MAAPFHRVEQNELIRGAARILYANTTTPKPSRISDVIYLTAGANEVQSIGPAGTWTSGTYTLSYNGYTTTPIPHNANAAAIQAALEALGSIGAGNVAVTGGPLSATGPTVPAVVTFQGVLAAQNVPLLTIDVSSIVGGGTAAVTVTTPGQGLYDPKAGWFELGATREGIQISVNNSEDAFDVDQVQGDIGAAPNAWECSISSRLAEMTLERLQFIWEGSDIITDSTPTIPEREIGFAGATEYTERRVAILFKRKKNGTDKIRAYFFHKCVRSPQEGTIDHRKGGDAQSVQMQLRVLADSTVADPKKQFFIIRDQV